MKSKVRVVFYISLDEIFKALVEPILLYTRDFWGIVKLLQNNQMENLHLSFCKQLLVVQKQQVLLELGKVPLTIFVQQYAIKIGSE